MSNSLPAVHRRRPPDASISSYPELVAQRIGRYVQIVGRERVIAGTDCGFGTFAGYGRVDERIAYRKLESLAEGAAIASRSD